MILGLSLLAIASFIAVIIIAGVTDEDRKPPWKLLWIPVGLALLVIVLGSFVAVPAGHRGVLLRFGKVTAVYNEGLNTKIPLIDKVVNMSVQTQLYEEPSASAASKDLQDVETSVAINYKLDPLLVGEIYRTLGPDYITKIARPAVQEIVKEVTASYNAEDMILRRADVKADITKTLQRRLEERGIISETVNITNFKFSGDFTKSIEAKVVAIQRVLEAENNLRRIEVEARQAEQKAKGDASAQIARAQGQAQANKILADSLTPELLQYTLIDKLAQNVQTIIVPQGMPLTFAPR